MLPRNGSGPFGHLENGGEPIGNLPYRLCVLRLQYSPALIISQLIGRVNAKHTSGLSSLEAFSSNPDFPVLFLQPAFLRSLF